MFEIWPKIKQQQINKKNLSILNGASREECTRNSEKETRREISSLWLKSSNSSNRRKKIIELFISYVCISIRVFVRRLQIARDFHLFFIICLNFFLSAPSLNIFNLNFLCLLIDWLISSIFQWLWLQWNFDYKVGSRFFFELIKRLFFNQRLQLTCEIYLCHTRNLTMLINAFDF